MEVLTGLESVKDVVCSCTFILHAVNHNYHACIWNMNVPNNLRTEEFLIGMIISWSSNTSGKTVEDVFHLCLYQLID